jgi:Rrf2 family protein
MINDERQVFSAKYLVDKLGIPEKYLRNLLTKLTKVNLIKSIKGRDGGFVFAKNADKITLAEIVDAVEGMKKYEKCILGFDHCDEKNPCALHSRWRPIKEQILNFLNNTTVADLKKDDSENIRY